MCFKNYIVTRILTTSSCMKLPQFLMCNFGKMGNTHTVDKQHDHWWTIIFFFFYFWQHILWLHNQTNSIWSCLQVHHAPSMGIKTLIIKEMSDFYHNTFVNCNILKTWFQRKVPHYLVGCTHTIYKCFTGKIFVKVFG